MGDTLCAMQCVKDFTFIPTLFRTSGGQMHISYFNVTNTGCNLITLQLQVNIRKKKKEKFSLKKD